MDAMRCESSGRLARVLPPAIISGLVLTGFALDVVGVAHVFAYHALHGWEGSPGGLSTYSDYWWVALALLPLLPLIAAAKYVQGRQYGRASDWAAMTLVATFMAIIVTFFLIWGNSCLLVDCVEDDAALHLWWRAESVLVLAGLLTFLWNWALKRQMRRESYSRSPLRAPIDRLSQKPHWNVEELRKKVQ